MYLVFDIGGTFLKYAIMDKDGNIISKDKTPSKKEGINEFLDQLQSIYEENKEVEGIALSVPGQVDIQKGIIYNGGALTFLHECHINDELSKRCDNKPVAVENDGKCAGLAESAIGAAKDVNDAVVLVFGTGVGGAIIKDKHVHHGSRMIAGELSFLMTDACTSPDHIRMWAQNGGSAVGLSMKLDHLKGQPKGTYNGEKLFELASQGDKEANEVLEEFYFGVAKKIYDLQYIMDPDVFCIGGGISEQPAVVEGINHYVDLINENSFQITKPKVVRCKYNNDSNLIGALFNFLQLHS